MGGHVESLLFADEGSLLGNLVVDVRAVVSRIFSEVSALFLQLLDFGFQVGPLVLYIREVVFVVLSLVVQGVKLGLFELLGLQIFIVLVDEQIDVGQTDFLHLGSVQNRVDDADVVREGRRVALEGLVLAQYGGGVFLGDGRVGVLEFVESIVVVEN